LKKKKQAKNPDRSAVKNPARIGVLAKKLSGDN
jgi:hypothetical protein